MAGSALVERAYRIRFGLRFFVLVTAGFAALTLFLYLATSRTLGGTYAEAVYTIYTLRINIFSLIFASFYSMAILVLVTAAAALISVFFSHRMAGPLFRIERNLEILTSGDLTFKTRFRHKDQLAPAAEELDRMVRGVNHMVRSAVEALEEMGRAEVRLKEIVAGKGSRQDVERTLAGLHSALGALERTLARVKTGRGKEG